MKGIQKHWHGEFSLPRSFWINGILLTLTLMFSMVVLVFLFPRYSEQFYFGFIVIVNILIYPWQGIGIWRSSYRYVEKTGNKFWAQVARICVALGFLGFIMDLMDVLPDYIDLF